MTKPSASKRILPLALLAVALLLTGCSADSSGQTSAEDPAAVNWSGGMWLDGRSRVRNVEPFSFLVVCRREREEEVRLLAGDIFNGAALEERPARVAAAFENEGYFPAGD